MTGHDDLVALLRSLSDCNLYDTLAEQAMRDAADEIERLRALVAPSTVVPCQHCGARLVGVVCADCGTPATSTNGHR